MGDWALTRRNPGTPDDTQLYRNLANFTRWVNVVQDPSFVATTGNPKWFIQGTDQFGETFYLGDTDGYDDQATANTALATLIGFT